MHTGSRMAKPPGQRSTSMYDHFFVKILSATAGLMASTSTSSSLASSSGVLASRILARKRLRNSNPSAYHAHHVCCEPPVTSCPRGTHAHTVSNSLHRK